MSQDSTESGPKLSQHSSKRSTPAQKRGIIIWIRLYSHQP